VHGVQKEECGVMERIDKHIEIAAPVEKVYEFMGDPKNLLEIWPSIVDVTHIQELPDGHMTYDWTYKMAGIRFNGTSRTTELVENERSVVVNEEGIPSKFVWEYHPSNGGTALDLGVEYAVPTPVLGKLAEKVVVKMNENEADTMLANLKIVMEASG
jgi:carbon monoxide dehydrogenase subunit G